ncbi:MAG: extracellular solute-binding protein [Candidatus Sericytochromatia bacterium]|nr:extracellular solute-binding protein [Candidatus Sericytochromatia bacterium]
MRMAARTLLSLGFVSMLLFSCQDPADPSVLTVWHSWGGAELDSLRRLEQIFKSRMPGTRIQSLQIPHDRLKDKFLRSAAANGGPDLLIGDNDWAATFADAELLLPVAGGNGDKMTPLMAEEEATIFPPAVREAVSVGETMVAWPESVEAVALYYNKRLVPRPPTTTARMFADANMVAKDDIRGLVLNTAFYFVSPFFLGGGGQVLDAKGRPTLDTAAGRRMLSWVRDAAKAPGVLATQEYAKPDALFKAGKAGMIVNGPWALADYGAKLGKDLGVAVLPRLGAGRPAAPWVGVKCLMVNANLPVGRRTLVANFLRLVAEPKIQRMFAETAGHVPAAKGVALSPDSPLAVFQRQIATGTPKRVDPRLGVVWEPMDRAIQETVVHGLSPADALKRAQQTIEARLSAMTAPGSP